MKVVPASTKAGNQCSKMFKQQLHVTCISTTTQSTFRERKDILQSQEEDMLENSRFRILLIR